MHEQSLLRGLMRQIQQIALAEDAARIQEVRLRLGALAHISADHLREHFEQAAHGTVAEGARLVIEVGRDASEDGAQDIRLESLVVED